MIVLDTNALMMPVECDVRVFEELDRLLGGGAAPRAADGPSGEQSDPRGVELVTPTAVVDELEKLADGAGDEATAASVGLDLADRCRTVETDADYADDAVLEVATGTDATHAVTNDKPLKRRLLDRGVPVIGLRAQHKLAITRP